MDEVWFETYLSARFPEGVKEERDTSTNYTIMMLVTKSNTIYQILLPITS